MENLVNMEAMWRDYGLNKLEAQLHGLFPEVSFSLQEILEQVLRGDILSALSGLLRPVVGGAAAQLTGMRNILVWLVVLGIVSALMTHFIEIFDRHQIADVGFYFMYLLLTAVLLECFSRAAQTAAATLESLVLFMKMLVPTFLVSVGAAAGATTVTAYYQLLLLLIFGVESLLAGAVLPLVYSYILLAVVNGVWIEEKLSLVMDLMEKGICGALKLSIGLVTGISVFQALITPVIDSVRAATFRKILSAIPGIGDAAEGVVKLVAGSAMVVKNSIGVVMLILLIVLCAAPLLQIFCTACLLKVAAAFMGMVSDSRITSCTNKVGEGSMLLFRATATALFLFLIVISIVATATNRGIS
ncbi:MAG: stage III sporulation protein AE [Clostridium sp.]|jgi:stage III sporulation protein AE|nr:stage III sporulation protein AE [Clostridium sp.]